MLSIKNSAGCPGTVGILWPVDTLFGCLGVLLLPALEELFRSNCFFANGPSGAVVCLPNEISIFGPSMDDFDGPTVLLRGYGTNSHFDHLQL